MAHKQPHQFIGLLEQLKKLSIEKDTISTISNTEFLDNYDCTKTIPDQQIMEVILSGCKSIHQDELARSFCRFMYKVFTGQIRTTSLRTSHFEICLNYLLDCLRTENNEYKVDILRTMSVLIYENSVNLQKSASRLVGNLLTLADKSVRPLEVRRMAINCIGNMISGSGSKFQSYTQDLYECLLSNICTVNRTSQGTFMAASNSLDFADPAIRKIASSTLRSLQFFLTQDKTLITNPLCDIVEIIHTYIFINVSVKSYSAVLPTSSNSVRRNKILQSNRASFPWRSSIHTNSSSIKHMSAATSSESELSDSSALSNDISPRRQREYSKIRINALLCLSAIALTTPKALYPRWHRFIPDTFSLFMSNNSSESHHLLPLLQSDNQPLSLFTLLLYDPSPNVRIAVCNTLISLLTGSKKYLSLAMESGKNKSSFTSLSENLGSTLQDFHAGIIQALKKETSHQVLTVIMTVTTTLIENCTYERLSKTLLPSTYQVIVPHWKEQGLRCSILKVLDAIFNALPADQGNWVDTVQSDIIPHIVLDAIHTDDKGIQEEGWQVCSTLTKLYFDKVMPSLWIQVNALFSNALPMSPGSMKFLDAYANAIQNREVQQPDVDWWKEVIEKYLQQAASNDMPVIRAAACDTFAYIPKDIFESFHYRYTRLSVALLFSLATDTDGHVRAAACRALGVFILYPSLRDDPMFVSEMAKTVLSHKEDKIVLVRVRSSWAIANLCDALLLESEKDSFNLREYISTSDWIDILTSATSAAMDNDKLRSNAVRAIGSLLRLTPKEYFENTRIMSLIANAMNSLVRNIETGPLKTRWNACHATSNMLSNPYFPIGYMKGGGLYPWTSLVYHALIQSLVQCKNFKVRINACLALNAPNHQSQYGDKLELIVDNILIAWDICQNNHEYKEIKYKEQLEEQIILTLEHMKPWLPSCYHESIKSRIATR